MLLKYLLLLASRFRQRLDVVDTLSIGGEGEDVRMKQLIESEYMSLRARLISLLRQLQLDISTDALPEAINWSKWIVTGDEARTIIAASASHPV